LKNVLVIGYGNTLRGDDGAGVRAVEMIEQQHPEYSCIIAHQLTPELAERIAEANIVFFIDAQTESEELLVRIIEPKKEPDEPHTHFVSPESLLSLSLRLYKKLPAKSYCIGIPASSLGFSEDLSPRTAFFVNECIEAVEKYCILQ
jgi:hydrogenase maturation protease